MWCLVSGPIQSSYWFICCCCSIIVQSCLTLFNPMDWSMPDFPCSSSLARACRDLCPLSQWCHPTSSSSVVLFSSCLQSFPASGAFLKKKTLAYTSWYIPLMKHSLKWPTSFSLPHPRYNYNIPLFQTIVSLP